jgi:alpha-1,2-mannosyltransferase
MAQSQLSYLLSSCRVWNFIVLPLHVAYRIYVANRMPIMDCDETFNYWEVVHFLLFRDKSFQTWEYANEFALRTYAYLTPIVGIGHIYLQILQSGIIPSWMWSLLTEQEFDQSRSSKIALFFLLRSTLGATTAYAEVSFCRAIVEQGYTADDETNGRNEISRRDKTNGKTLVPTAGSPYTRLWFTLVGWVTECLLFSSTGMAHSAAALLPSSTLMGLWMLAAAAYLRKENVRFCVLAITATLAVGWPFGVLVFIPLGIGVLVREQKEITAFIFLRIVPITIVVQGLVMLVDYQHYGRIVSPSWNILLYNTQAGGDELYGVEPLSYYIKNLVLNFNYVALVGAIGILPLMLPLLWSGSSSSTWLEGWILMTPFYLWIWVVFPRPHKEERFLFPIYPCLCLGAAIVSVSFTQGVLKHPWRQSQQGQQEQKHKLTRNVRESVIILALIWIPAATISWSRTVALSKYYSAPLHVYSQLPAALATEAIASFKREGSNSPASSTHIVCTCGEWYRYPSSFFIESESSKVVFGFAPSTFTGQLPQPFTKEGSGPPPPTSNHFNDKNQHEAGSYTPLESCDFVIELSTSLQSCIGQNGSNNDDTEWNPIVKEPFFDTEATTSTLHRILYIPLLHDYAVQSGKVQYVDFVLYAK